MYYKFLKRNFLVEVLKQPIFHSFEKSLRVLLDENDKEYAEQLDHAVYTTIEVAEQLFDNEDDIYLCTYIDAWNEEPIGDLHELTHLYDNYLKDEDIKANTTYREITERYEQDEEVQTYEVSLAMKYKDLHIDKLIKEKMEYYFNIGDFQLGEIYILNETKKIIFHPYDD